MKKDKPQQVDIVIPVYNEEKILAKSIATLVEFLSKRAFFSWKIIIADNASTDKTLEIARDLSTQDDHLEVLHIDKLGRGLALRTAWMSSQAEITSYMDVDLSTNLNYFPLAIEGLKCGYDISIGSRLMQASLTRRSVKREIISRGYNTLIKMMFLNPFSDAQCGFKVIKTRVARDLLPQVKDNEWFFDTELLLKAVGKGYRIFELPVEWTEDLDSRVKIFKTAAQDVTGLIRVKLELSLGSLGRKVFK